MKLTNLAMLITSAIAMSACGGGGSSSDGGSATPTSTVQKVVLDTYSSANVAEAAISSSSFETQICLDTNKDDGCEGESSLQTVNSLHGEVELSWDSSTNVEGLNILAKSSYFTYSVKASDAVSSEQAADRSTLYLNPITNASNKMGSSVFAQTVGFEGDDSTFSSTTAYDSLDNSVKILGDSIGALQLDANTSSGSNLFDTDNAKTILSGAFQAIVDAINAAGSNIDSVSIVFNIKFNNNFDNINNPQQPTGNNAPDVEFNFVVSNTGLVTFTNLSTDEDGDPLTYKWDFGDSTSSNDTSPKHQYTTAKSYAVTLFVSDGNTIESKTQKVDVSYVPASTLAPTFTSTVDNTTVTFVNTTKEDEGSTVTYRWDFGDGSEISTEKSPVHTYSANGSYTVKLQATTATGSKAITTNVVKVGDDASQVILTASANHTLGSNGVANFVASTSYTGSSTLNYSWDYGDGSTGTGKTSSHTYTKNGVYSIVLTVNDNNGVKATFEQLKVTISNISDIEDPEDPVCSEDDPYCKDDIDPADCQQTCTTITEQECTTVTAAVQDSSSVTQIDTQYYSTNPNGQVGKNKTISSMSDWTADMIIAQGAANDDPRAYRGYHEKATDFYALYAAWDDTNLYLMVEMPNLSGAEPGGDFDYSSDQFLPMGIGIRTGKRPAGNGLLTTGNNVWTADKFYTIDEGIDTLLMFHPRIPTVNTPGLFKTNDSGLFSYDEKKEGYLLGFAEAGIEREVKHTTLSKNYFGVSDNYGLAGDSYKTSTYTDLLASNENASGHLYQVTIPLASIDITKSDIESNGIAVVAFSTFGESMMDALPWTPNLVDVAAEAYSKDSSTSQEKEDFDDYNVRLASIGVLNGASGSGSSGGSSGGSSEVCKDVIKTVCTPETLPESCSVAGTIDVTLSHTESTVGTVVSSAVKVATGYKGVTYTWEVTGQKSVTSAYNETSKTFSFTKSAQAQQITVKVTASNASGTKTGSESFAITIPACSGDECGTISSDWVENKGFDTSNIKVYDPNNTCKAPDNSLILKADVTSAPNVYMYKDKSTTYTAAWPGDQMVKLDGCTSTFWTYTPSVSLSSALAIFNAVGSDRYPAEMQLGIEYTSSKPCFDWSTKTLLSAEECGLGAQEPVDTAYIVKNGSEVASGSTINIVYNDANPKSAYVDVSLMVYGADTSASSTGTYTVDGKSASFTNGQIIRIGENIAAAADKASATPMTLEVSFGGNTSTYTFIKTVYQAPTASTQFTWNNALIYFVMTDRFQNGKTSNDHSYGRPSSDSTGHPTATFHGGDIVGMTERLDYLKSLGMNAVWITAPYEQSHGWTGGGSSGAFAHYAYHGYYALDFTSMDANVGTIDEFRTFVTEAHKRGIRVVLDIVMNHSGYATLKDMCDFGFGVRSDGGSACDDWIPGSGQIYHNKPISEAQDTKWDAWWGKNWILFGGYGEQCGSGDGLDACVSYLPDFKNSQTNGTSVSVPTFLSNKWSNADAEHDVPAAKQYRSGNMSVAQFQAHWLASWVEEFGIDGFRSDTAKHVTKSTWKLLKQYCQEGLEKWRSNTSVSEDPAAAWTDNFWMTGEHWGYKTDPSDDAGYASEGGFDSMINFSFNGQAGGSCSVPNEGTWESYASNYGVGSGSPKLNALTYVSSHDTSLCRVSDMKNLGTMLELLPGGVQVYYGDETSRANDNGGNGNDAEHGTRSDMNFPSDISSASDWAANVDTLSTSFASDATLAHWQKVGQFRFRNAAVGAGKQTKTSDGSYCRVYNDESVGINNSVVIHVGSASSVDVGNCFADGTELQDGYSGATGTVSGGKVSLSGTSGLILLELKR